MAFTHTFGFHAKKKKKNTTADDGPKVTIPAPANVVTKVTIPALDGKTGGADNGTFIMVFLQGAAAAK